LLSFTRSEFVIVVCAFRIPIASTKLVNKSILDLFMSPFCPSSAFDVTAVAGVSEIGRALSTHEI